MKVIIDIPDKYLKACDYLLSVMADYETECQEEKTLFESMKDETIELDPNKMMDSAKAKELCIGLAMVAIAQKKGEEI